VKARELLDPDSSMYHWIAVDLHFWRNRQGMSCSEVAALLGITRGSVSNMEACRPGHRLTAGQAAVLDEAWDLNGHFTRQLRYARCCHEPTWRRTRCEYEARSQTIKVFEPMVVPGLFQTPEYARTLVRTAGSPDVESDVLARMARQEVLVRDPLPDVQALLDESVLDRPVGGPGVMRPQLAYLLELTELPNVAIRIVPRSAGAYPGLHGPFEVFSVLEGPVAYAEAHGGGRLILDPDEIESLDATFVRIGTDALPREASRDRIRQVMEAM
jgi:hypothetical protein